MITLKSISRKAIDVIDATDIKPAARQYYKKTFMEAFLLFSFSEHRCQFSQDDCIWFYELVNQQTHFVHKESMEFWSQCAPFCVSHLILSRILSCPLKLETEVPISPTRILDLFDEKVGANVIFYGEIKNVMILQQRRRVGEMMLAGKQYEEITHFIPAMYTILDKVCI